MEEQIKKMEEQMKEQFGKAFYDVIRDSITNSNFDHIVRLYTEIRDRIASKVTEKGTTYQQIHEQFDVEFFEQLLRNNVFDGNSLTGLVNTTFRWIHDLQMPMRDTTTNEAKQRVLQSGTTMVEVVPVYIQEVHKCLDVLEQDFKEFYENRNHPAVQHMLRQALALAKK